MGVIPTGDRMKIGLVIYGDLRNVTGGFFYDRKMVDYFTSQGDTVEVFSLPMRSYAKSLLDNFDREFLRRLLQAQLDVVLQDELNHPSLFLVNKSLKRHTRYPMVSIVHHLRSSELRSELRNRLYAVVERRYLDSVDGFIFNSETTKRTVEDLVGAAKPSVVAYPAADHLDAHIDDDRIRERAHESGPIKIVFVGSLIRRKELHTLIKAVGALPKDSCLLDVIGRLDVDPLYVQEIQDIMVAQGVKHHVSIHGPLDHRLLRDHLREAHGLAVPSSYEGFGLVYLEGMAFGLPAIASTAGAARETVTHGENGFLVEPGDPQPIARVIRRLHADRNRLADMGVAARKRFLEHPTWEQSAEKARSFLLDMTAPRRRRRGALRRDKRNIGLEFCAAVDVCRES